jgi:hypothetical protein
VELEIGMIMIQGQPGQEKVRENPHLNKEDIGGGVCL